MAEAFENERKKWNDGRNIIKNDYGIRRRYIEQLREMQTKEKKDEFKYNIMKVKIQPHWEEGNEKEKTESKQSNDMDITRNHWRIKRIEMLGQRNKKLILVAKEKQPKESSPRDFNFITPEGEFALGDNIYVKFNKSFNPGTNMRNLDEDIFELYCMKWKFEIQDRAEIMRSSAGKKAQFC